MPANRNNWRYEQKSPETPPKPVNRRRKQDWVARAAPVCSVIGWIGGSFGVLCFSRARPRTSGFVDTFFGVVGSSWNKQYLYLSLVLMSAAFIVGAVGFLFNLRRNKRKTDHIYKSLLVLCGCMILVMAYVMIRFMKYLF